MDYTIYIWEIISYILITIISSLIYVYFKYQDNNKFLRLFVPKNDSIWERLKVVLSTFIIIKVIENILIGFNSNVLFSTFISILIISFINMVSFILIYLYTKYDIIIQNIFANVISILVSLVCSLFIVSLNEFPIYIGIVSITGIVIFILFYITATYYQTNDLIFIDPNSKKNKLKKDS